MKKLKIGFIIGVMFGVIGIDCISAKPANTLFNDDNFYECVIERYNKENDTTYDVSYNLSDDELNQITYLTCSEYKKILDYTGIEKLTSLEKIRITVAAESIDLSHNLKLEDVTLNEHPETAIKYVSYLKNLNIGDNKNLYHLRVDSDLITEIDVSKNTNLTELAIWSKNLRSVDLSNNSKLKSLYLGSNIISSLNISNLEDLILLKLNSYPLNSIDLSKNIKLKSLYMKNGKLLNIDLSNNKELETISLPGNSLSQIDLSNNSKVTSLYLEDNLLERIDLSNNSFLEKLQLYGNKFMSNIELNKVGDSVLLSDYIKLPEGYSFGYKVNDESIAKVEDGKIVGLQTGNTTGVLTISNTYNQVLADNGEGGTVINGVTYKYVIEDIKFDSIITVSDSKNKVNDITNEKQDVDNPKTGVYAGSFIVILASAIGISVIRKFNNVKKI